MTAVDEDLLDARTVIPYLRERGLLISNTQPEVSVVAGGVSNVVLAVTDGVERHILKQAMGRLDVPGEWTAMRERTLVEAAALALASSLTPANVPAPRDVDADALVLVIPAAPASWRNMKDRLMEGQIGLADFATLGALLATWHNATIGLARVTPACDDQESFRQLRTDPFHRVVAQAHRDLAGAVLACASELEDTRHCLVHGDFSPKNVLSGNEGLWVIDFEVAHIGAPVFDLAYLLTHIVLKAVHLPQHRHALQAAAATFLGSYTAKSPEGSTASARLLPHLGCILLARVDGLSPAAYLTEAERTKVRALGRRLVRARSSELGAIWAALAEVEHDG